MNTPNDVLNDIRNQIDQLLALVVSQQKDINKIQKWIAKQDKKKRPVPCSAVITCPADTYEYGEVTIQLDVDDWMEIKKGLPMTIQGQGSRVEGLDDDEVVQDHWSFNEKASGYVEIKMAAEEEPEWWDVAFSGDIGDCEIVETPVKRKRVRGA